MSNRCYVNDVVLDNSSTVFVKWNTKFFKKLYNSVDISLYEYAEMYFDGTVCSIDLLPYKNSVIKVLEAAEQVVIDKKYVLMNEIVMEIPKDIFEVYTDLEKIL